jgi:hypothetical protein
MHGKAQSGTERAAAARNIESILRIEKEDAENFSSITARSMPWDASSARPISL